ncbi:iron chelate uptake ABC transporter family permease subunit [Candidatus Peregrinibacteria bacterium]|nr:iron chelate uptake ABC transporter family permease subunit [Candidatus Peregrinibacteria bacterium]
MLEILQLPFMERALIAGIILAALMAILGVFVVLRKMAFFSDGIAHASLAGVALGIVFSWNPLIVALISSAVFAAIIFLLQDKFNINSDTAIGILFTSGMALGVLLISLQPGYQPELMSFLFGNILAITKSEIPIILVVSLVIVCFILHRFKQLILVSIDEETAMVSGIRVKSLQLALYILLALAVVLGIKILGVILVSALLIIPIASAKIFAKSIKALIILSIIIAEVVMISGIFLSYYIDLPTGPIVILLGTAGFVLSGLIKIIFSRN